MLDDALLTAASSLGGTVLIIGDVMLDVYAYGQTNRISPEAPIPVMRLTHETRMLGGAGNVARNVAALGGTALLVGVVGDDASGHAMSTLVEHEERVADHLLRSKRRQTTVKRRFVVGNQQMLRVDEEDVGALDEIEEAGLISRIEKLMALASAVILSDYRKGALTPAVIASAIAAARAAGRPIFIDPKHVDGRHYAGATAITPNAAELAQSTSLPVDSDETAEVAARLLLARCGADFIIVTRSADGLSYVPANGNPLHVQARRREVFDVSGAGDTVIATLALAIGSGVDAPVAAALANVAAGVVVGKPGTATCALNDIELELIEAGLRLGAKLQAIDRAARVSDRWRTAGLRVGFTNGCFDLLHPGHVALLATAKAGCDRLIVGLNSDASVRRLKGSSRPLQSQAARAAVLAALASVDVVVIFDDDTPLKLLGQLRPAKLFKGADYTIDTVVGANLVKDYGGTVELIDLVEGQSTTGIVSRMS